jgi:4a-hydroxytetrahydrobiopterin dehydratase
VQPWPERPAFVEAPERGERPLEPIRGDVVCERRTPRDGEGRTPCVAPVTAEERRSSVTVAASGLPYEVSVTWLTHSFTVWYDRSGFARPEGGILTRVTDWDDQAGALVREFELPSFPAAIEFVDRLAELAESEDHHPDIDIRYRRVTVRWTTHSEGGITDKDREMAERTSALVAA